MRLLPAFFLLSFAVSGLYGQNTIGLPAIHGFSKLDYRGGTQTWDMAQDSMGRMYFANNEGLLIYNGSYWSLQPLPNKTIMRSVALADSGKIYVGGQGEVGYFQPGAQGNLVYHSLLPLLPPSGAPLADVWDLAVFGDAIFMRASDRIMELRNGAIRNHVAANEWLFLQTAGKHLFAQDSRIGLMEFASGSWRPVPGGDVLASRSARGIIPFTGNAMLLATYQNQFCLLDSLGLRSPQPIPVNLSGQVFTIDRLNEDEFVLGTTSGGCIVLNHRFEVVQSLTTAEGLADNSVLCTFLDRDGNLWAGLNHGIGLVNYNAAIKYIQPQPGSLLSGYSVRRFDGKLYVATSSGVYNVAIPSGNSDLSFVRSNWQWVSGSQGQAYRLDEVNGQLLLAHNEGSFEIAGSTTNRLSYDAAWLFKPLSSVFPSKEVLAGNYTGLKLLRYTNESFSAGNNLEGPKESLRFLEIANDGTIWASHPYRGVYRISLNESRTGFDAKLYGKEHGLPSNLENYVFYIKNRVVYATQGGVYEFDKKAERFMRSAFLDSAIGALPIRYLQDDSFGNIWFVSGKQLGVLYSNGTANSYSRMYFPELTGKVLSGFEQVNPLNQENVFVASEQGIIHLNLLKYQQRSGSPSLVLHTVGYINRPDSLVAGAFIHAVKPGSTVSIPFRLNSLHFEFSAPAYGFQENMLYSYKLEGYEKEWSEWSTKTEKDYTNLPSGNYTFAVRARNNMGAQTEATLFVFSVAAPWYRSTAAYVVYALLIMLVIYLLRQLHERRLMTERSRFEEAQRQLQVAHQLQVEQNEKEIMRLQNEALASEVNFKNRELAESTMHLVERSDALAKVREQLQRLVKAQPANTDVRKAINVVSEMEKSNEDFGRFATSFDEINNGFLLKLKQHYPSLTNNDLKLCAYLLLNMTSKEIAQLLKISTRGVEISRYRLRKKLNLDTGDNIADFLRRAVDPTEPQGK